MSIYKQIVMNANIGATYMLFGTKIQNYSLTKTKLKNKQ